MDKLSQSNVKLNLLSMSLENDHLDERPTIRFHDGDIYKQGRRSPTSTKQSATEAGMKGIILFRVSSR